MYYAGLKGWITRQLWQLFAKTSRMSRQKRPRLNGNEYIKSLTTNLGVELPIYGEVADTLDSNLCFDPEDMIIEIDNVDGFPEYLMLDNLESTIIPLGRLSLPISSEAESSIYNQDRQILLGNVCCGMEDWRNGFPKDPVIDIAESRTMFSGSESTIYHHTQVLGSTGGIDMKERIPGLPENLMNMDNVAYRTMPLRTLPSTVTSKSKSNEDTQIFQSILCSNMEEWSIPLPLGAESSIYDKETHILQSDLCFDMEELRSGLPEDLMSDNLESKNIALGILSLTLNPGMESLMYDADTQNLQSNMCLDLEGMAT